MNNIFKGIAALALAGSITSCSGDYLELPPESEVNDTQIAESIEGSRAALYGLCQAMYIGTYGSGWIRISNGEGYFRTVYGDSGTPDFFDPWLYGYQTETQLWELMTTDGNIGNTFAWGYCYNLIHQANVILRDIDNVPAEESEVHFVKAQALTMRAHAYIHLMQVYGPRFEDANNGDELCYVLRLEPGTGDLPLSSYKDCMGNIYEDLETAISLFEGSDVKRKYGFEPDINVARGLLSRAALMNHDWNTAQTMAHDARASYPIMTAEQYKAGFAEHNDEWMWYNLPDKTTNGYNSWGASFSCNGAYATAYNWSSAGNISWDFYKMLYAKNPNDIRLELFWTPDKANKYVNFKIKDSDFWNPSKINPEFFFMYGPNEEMSAAISLFISHNTPEGFEGGYSIDTSLTDAQAKNAVARKKWYTDNASIAKKKTDGRVQFGAQIKFWSSLADLGASEIPFMRAGELILNEAEAAMEAGDETTAQKCLVDLNKNRIPGYSCTLTGDALRQEIRLTRRIELWGEGDTWFAMKRWNIDVERRIWEKGNPNSNNMMTSYKGSYPASYNKGWRFMIPRQETNYNNLINK
ncbi:MAG: RagB/SusD family nutrient uptake outer membrane protein [Muribaculaceae bacterium]|nr:RagB/SusD family nutrient uptake outer membrane protein [Muribaculaceae bacterium]